jgi:copper chaperone CopZ
MSLAGVKSIDANVEAKTVIVEADDSVSPHVMLEKLQKVDRNCCDCVKTKYCNSKHDFS